MRSRRFEAIASGLFFCFSSNLNIFFPVSRLKPAKNTHFVYLLLEEAA